MTDRGHQPEWTGPENTENPNVSQPVEVPESPPPTPPPGGDAHAPPDHVKRHFYCGVDGDLKYTRIVAIEKNPACMLDFGKRYDIIRKDVDIRYMESVEVAEFIARGIERLMGKITGQPNTWREWVQIDNIVVVFQEPLKDEKMWDVERDFNKNYVTEKTVTKEDGTEEELTKEQRKEEEKVKIAEAMCVMTEVEMVAKTHFRETEEALVIQCGIDTAFCYKKNDGGTIQIGPIPSVTGSGGAYWIAQTGHRVAAKIFRDFRRALDSGPNPAFDDPERANSPPMNLLPPCVDWIVQKISKVFDMGIELVWLGTAMIYHSTSKFRYGLVAEELSKVSHRYNAIPSLYHIAGEIIGEQAANHILEAQVGREVDSPNEPLTILTYGRVFNSYHLMEHGFKSSLLNHGITQVRILRKREISASAAAIHAARLCGATDVERWVFDCSEPVDLGIGMLQRRPYEVNEYVRAFVERGPCTPILRYCNWEPDRLPSLPDLYPIPAAPVNARVVYRDAREIGSRSSSESSN